MAIRKKLAIILPDEATPVGSVLSYAQNVRGGLTDNVGTFATPTPTVAALDTAIDELQAAYDIPGGDVSYNTNLTLAEKKDNVLSILTGQSGYVLMVANGDRIKADKSGFQLNVEETVPKTPAAFSAVFMRAGQDNGSANIRILERAGNALFIVQLKVGDALVMIDAFNTMNFTVEGLPSGSSILRIYGKKGTKKSPAVELVVKAL